MGRRLVARVLKLLQIALLAARLLGDLELDALDAALTHVEAERMDLVDIIITILIIIRRQSFDKTFINKLTVYRILTFLVKSSA